MAYFLVINYMQCAISKQPMHHGLATPDLNCSVLTSYFQLLTIAISNLRVKSDCHSAWHCIVVPSMVFGRLFWNGRWPLLICIGLCFVWLVFPFYIFPSDPRQYLCDLFTNSKTDTLEIANKYISPLCRWKKEGRDWQCWRFYWWRMFKTVSCCFNPVIRNIGIS